MATQYVEYPAVPVHRAFSWTGIFAGTFLFLAIEITFGVLGAAIFGSATNPVSANPVGPGISAGLGIWMVILSIIALYCGGKLAGRLTGATTRNMGMYAGLVTFGMSVFSAVLIVAFTLIGTVGGTTGIAVASPYRLDSIVTTGGYWLFVALVLAMLAAAWGGIHGAERGTRGRLTTTTTTGTTATTTTVPPEERRAA
ncbi:MAG: hypothetical protein ACRD3F_03600 [Acidobacteriaceae bacterium]